MITWVCVVGARSARADQSDNELGVDPLSGVEALIADGSRKHSIAPGSADHCSVDLGTRLRRARTASDETLGRAGRPLTVWAAHAELPCALKKRVTASETGKVSEFLAVE